MAVKKDVDIESYLNVSSFLIGLPQFGYAVPSGADHIPQALAFLTHLSTPQAQALIAKESFFSGVTYAPARADVDPALLRADQRRALTLRQETDEAVPTLWLALPRPVWGMMLSEFSRFLREPHDVDIFMQKLEEIRQKAVANGQLSGEYTNERQEVTLFTRIIGYFLCCSSL